MTDQTPIADELSAVFARMSGMLLSRDTVNGALELVTSLATETIQDATGSGVTLLDEHGEPTTTAASDPVVARADALQYELGEGPCLTAWAQRVTVLVDDIATDGRWPRWAEAAAPLAVRSSLSAPLVADGIAVGAIKVYAPPARRIQHAGRAAVGPVRRPGRRPDREHADPRGRASAQ